MIDPKAMVPIFSSVFMAEMGDKTQLATVCCTAAGGCSKKEVFAASSLALVLSTLLAVLFGSAVSHLISPAYLKMGAGVIFVCMGFWFIMQGRRMKPEKSEAAGPCA